MTQKKSKFVLIKTNIMEDLNSHLQTFQKVDSLRNNALQENFPGIQLDGWGQSGPDFYAYLPKKKSSFYKLRLLL